MTNLRQKNVWFPMPVTNIACFCDHDKLDKKLQLSDWLPFNCSVCIDIGLYIVIKICSYWFGLHIIWNLKNCLRDTSVKEAYELWKLHVGFLQNLDAIPHFLFWSNNILNFEIQKPYFFSFKQDRLVFWKITNLSIYI